MMSVVSIRISATNIGVAISLPLSRTRKRWPSAIGVTGMMRATQVVQAAQLSSTRRRSVLSPNSRRTAANSSSAANG